MSSFSRGITRSEALDDGNQLNNSLYHLYQKKLTMIRSCSEITRKGDYSSWPGQLTRSKSGTSNEMPLIGECRYCDRNCRCSCCPRCDHLVIIYAPVCFKTFRKKHFKVEIWYLYRYFFIFMLVNFTSWKCPFFFNII